MPDAGRVIAGTARSIRLEAPGPNTRPLGDRVKQTLFAILEPDLRGARFLDLFAGSGAAGIEALSRGAAHATFVERDRAAVGVIESNLDRTGLRAGGRARIVRADALTWLRDAGRSHEQPFDVAFVDPPYDDETVLRSALEDLPPLVAPDAQRRREALLADRSSDRRRTASIRARAAVRRDCADVLPAARPDARSRGEHGGRMSVAVYPGSFDPITNGHLDIVERAANVFDTVVVAVLANPRKAPLLSVDERIEIIRQALIEHAVDADRIEVASFDGLTVDFARARDAGAIVRGLRAISDFEAELQLAHNNRVLAPHVNSVFFMTSAANSYVSSSLVKEIASFGGDVSTMVPPAARAALERVFTRR